MNVMHSFILVLNLILVQLDAIVDYAALPIYIKKYARPDCDLLRLMTMGHGVIALLVGMYTCVALAFYSTDRLWASSAFAAFLAVDIFFSVFAIIRHKQTVS